MSQVFRDRCVDLLARGSRLAALGEAVALAADFLGSVVRERLAATSIGSVIAMLASLLCGLLVAYVDCHNDEVQAAVLVVLVTTFVLGLARPAGAWRWALAVGLFIPAEFIAAPWFGYTPLAVPDSIWSTLLALVPAMIGAYAGAFARRILGVVEIS